MSSGTIVEFYMQEDTGVFYFSVQEIPEDILKIHTRKKKRKKKTMQKACTKIKQKKTTQRDICWRKVFSSH